MLAAWEAWDAAGIPGPLSVTSFERFPLAPADIARALSRWPGLADRAARLLPLWPLSGSADLGSLRLTLIGGDARVTLPRWDGMADAWFLDGFSPARNPEMWEAPLLAAVAARTAAGGSFATFTAAGHVRRALEAAGFRVGKRPGFGRKREMSAGRLPAMAAA